jgi:GNAT superfamily N-acetyltransferase
VIVDLELRQLVVEDAGELLTVQRAAFLAEARLYGTTEIPPLVETLDDLRDEIAATITIGAFRGRRLIGAARLTVHGPVGWISRVAVAPDLQGRGVATAVLAHVEQAAPPSVQRFQLATGAKSTHNVAMYERRGYREFDRTRDSAGVELIRMRKDR